VEIVLQQGRIDVAVNNAGLMSIGLAERFTEKQLPHQMTGLRDKFVAHRK
jgi:hypothetical protein